MTEITRGRQYELGTNPDDGPQFVEDRPKPFNLMIRRPCSRDIYLSPTYDDLAEYARRPPFKGDDERENRDTDWSLTLPHHCGEWPIGLGAREEVLTAALAFRVELDQAIGALDAAGSPAPHRVALSVRALTPEAGSSFSITHPAACDRVPYGERCWFDEARPALPGSLGVYDAVLLDGEVRWVRIRDLEPGDWHG